MTLELSIEDVEGDMIPNLARFAHYIGVVAQINGSAIQSVTISGRMSGPEVTSADGHELRLGARALPPMHSVKPTAIAAWCGAALHGFAHSRYSPRTDEPLRATLQKNNGRLHRTWNMIEDARIERLLLRDFPGWLPHMMGACNHILLSPTWRNNKMVKPDLMSVYPLIVGRTYLPAALRQESYEAFAEEHSEHIADAVRDLVFEYLTLVDPGSEDHDRTVAIVSKLHALLGDYGSDCGSHDVEGHDVDREWTDPGDPTEDDEDEELDVDPDDDGNHEDTDESDEGEGDADGDESDEADDAEGDGSGEGDDELGDEEADAEAGGSGDTGDDGDEDADGEGGDEGTDQNDADSLDGDDEWDEEDWDDDDDEDEADDDEAHGSGVGGVGQGTSRLADWTAAIDSSLAQDQRLNDVAEAVMMGPMPLIKLPQRPVEKARVPFEVQQAELDIARELRVLMDGARPGMKRRIDRGRFNITRLVREGGTTRPEEMFDRHDPGALRSTGCAVAVLADVSGSMSSIQIAGAMSSVWSIDRAVQSVRGKFQGYTFGLNSEELPPSQADGMWVPLNKDGNTNPVAGLAAAQAWLSQQREPNKLCIAATDGSWDGANTATETLLSMAGAGVTCAVFGINCNVAGRFKAPIMTATVTDASQLGPIIGEMLVNRVRKSLAR